MSKLMMMTVSVLLTINISFSQIKSTIEGTVKDNAGKALPLVNISLLKSKDSSLVKTEISNEQGKFTINTIEGNYFLSYTLVGYGKKTTAAFTVSNNKTYTAPEINLQPEITKLQEVTVVAKKPMIEVKADKTVFNVENSINATGSNALELLQKSPGIQVDNNDNISMKGKTGTKIYIDGKMTQLDAKTLADYLRSINSNDIEAIEMISNPSAKYDASGNAGIINIRLKKNKKYGTNGSISTGYVQGVTPKGNTALSLNYRNKKVNLFSNFSENLGMYENGLNLYRIQKDTLYDQHSLHHSNNKSFNGKAGADFFINSRTTIGVMATGNFGTNDWTSNSQTDISYDPTQQYIKSLYATNDIFSKRKNADFNINYRYADTSGTEINFDGDYGFFSNRSNSYQPNLYYDETGAALYSVIYRNNAPIDINIYTAKVDVEKKAWKGKLGYGAKFSYVTTQNTFDFFNVIGGDNVKILNKSNYFSYKENVNAAYVNYQRQLNEKWSIQTGLRLEQTNREGILTREDGIIQPDNDVKKNYLDFFPSAAITWNINKKHTLNLTYSRRIDRPSYQDLNPFENKLDELTYDKGNAFLLPQYTDNVELTHTFMGFLNTSVGYSYVKDYATQVTDTINNATYVQQQNLATQQIISFNVGSSLPIKKWWNGYANFWYNYQLFNGHINDKIVQLSIPLYGAYLQQTFTLGNDYTAELNGWYNGPGLWGATWRNKPQGGLDAGIQKLLMQKKATLKISVTDIFFTSPWASSSDFGGLNIRANGYWESRTLKVSFTYRFGSSQVKSARQRQTGLESESKRIK
ncbi:MAG: TonB-dependent receptor [Bacteroidota bacterium]|nr:TonB-dependent receptor [Bacteroidota bacterium]